MRKENVGAIAVKGIAMLVMLGAAHQAIAQNAATPYAKMAPVDQYLMVDQSAEIALARSAAPESIAQDAAVLVLGRHGFETAVKGTNGFVCFVGRSWTSTIDAEYWNPKVRVPMCVNAAAAHTYLPRITRISEMALAGRTVTQVNDAMAAAVASKQLSPMEDGAMCYMMSKYGYGGDGVPHWASHVMFFYSHSAAASWGANQPGSPVLAVEDPQEDLTQFAIGVQRWSDGTESPLTPATPVASAAAQPASQPHEHP